MRLPHTKELIEGSIDESRPYLALILILEATQELLQLPKNDFSWTYWHNTEEATKHISRLIRQIKVKRQLSKVDIDILFAPTGPLQEVSINSGWSELFIKVADKYDQVAKLIWPGVD